MAAAMGVAKWWQVVAVETGVVCGVVTKKTMWGWREVRLDAP